MKALVSNKLRMDPKIGFILNDQLFVNCKLLKTLTPIQYKISAKSSYTMHNLGSLIGPKTFKATMIVWF